MRVQDRQACFPFRRHYPRGADARSVAAARRSGIGSTCGKSRQTRFLGSSAGRRDAGTSGQGNGRNRLDEGSRREGGCYRTPLEDRKSVVEGKRVSVRVDIGGG